MPRADLLLELVRAGGRGDQALFRKTVEALAAEERARQHHVLADRLTAQLQASAAAGGAAPRPAPTSPDPVVEVQPRRRLDDLILPEGVVSVARELIEEQQRADLLRSHGLEPRHRVLLAGPPGNGKTSLAEVFAAELMVPLLVVRYEAVITSYLGETALRLARLFDLVRVRRCVLFFDEFDVVGKERGDVHETGEIKRLVSSLLLQVDTLPSYVVVVTATNHPELLDRAVWRRFQLRLNLSPPTNEQLEDWLRRFETALGEGLGLSRAVLARRLQGLNFGDLEQFGADVLRRRVLALPNADLRRILNERLEQLKAKFSIEGSGRRHSRAENA